MRLNASPIKTNRKLLLISIGLEFNFLTHSKHYLEKKKTVCEYRERQNILTREISESKHISICKITSYQIQSHFIEVKIGPPVLTLAAQIK